MKDCSEAVTALAQRTEKENPSISCYEIFMNKHTFLWVFIFGDTDYVQSPVN